MNSPERDRLEIIFLRFLFRLDYKQLSQSKVPDRYVFRVWLDIKVSLMDWKDTGLLFMGKFRILANQTRHKDNGEVIEMEIYIKKFMLMEGR